MYSEDTIAAIASGLVTSGIGIIRISGPQAIAAAEKTVRLNGAALSDISANTARYGHIFDGTELIDEAIVIVMRAPHSYTGEDVVEIQCHGGPYLMKKVLSAVISAGARMAEPGEFTKRAFLSGRLDLAQAEAVMSLISSSTEYARRSALLALSGALSQKAHELRDMIIYDTAYLEAAMDDPEHIDAEGYREKLAENTRYEIGEIETLIRNADAGRVFREGIKTVILGSPNVGKSTLMNSLLGADRAIVTDIPGTTRDTLEESVRLGELMLVLTDTAGIRQTDDAVEKVGVERAKRAAETADLVLYMLDGTRKLDPAEIEEAEKLGENVIILINKTDLDTKTTICDVKNLTNKAVLEISAKSGSGRQKLTEEIYRLFDAEKVMCGESMAAANERQKQELITALNALQSVLCAISSGVSEDLFTIDMMQAYKSLGNITGEEIKDDLADEIFARFCMGK